MPVFPFGFMHEVQCGSVPEFAGVDGENNKRILERAFELPHTNISDPWVFKITSVI